jgi:hypothetical protein
MSVVSIADLFKVGPPLTEVEQVGRTPSIDALSDRAMAGGTLRLFDQRREGKTSLALAVLARAHAAHLATCNLPLDEYPTAQAAAARILAQFGGTLRAARRTEQIGGAAARIAGLIARATGSEDLILQFLGEPFVVPHIAREDWQHDLRERFKRADLSLDPPALERLLDLSTGQPYCTMLLARQCAELGGAFGTVNVDVVDLELPTVERHEAWQRLRYS